MNDQINANIETANKLAELQAKYQAMMIERRRAELEFEQKSIAIETDRLVLQTKMWSFQQKRNIYLSYIQAGRKCEQDLRQLKYAFASFRIVDECDKAQWYKVRSAWLLVSRYVSSEWKVQRMDAGEPRIAFMARCTLRTPTVGSQDHLDFISCVGQCGSVLVSMYAGLSATLDKLKSGAIDVWKQPDWTAK